MSRPKTRFRSADRESLACFPIWHAICLLPSTVQAETSQGVPTSAVWLSTTIREDTNVLVLSRKLGESICLNDNIEVVVTAIQGNRVSLGIAAPKSIGIRRGELLPAELAHVGRTESNVSGVNEYPGTASLEPYICPPIEPAALSAK